MLPLLGHFGGITIWRRDLRPQDFVAEVSILLYSLLIAVPGISGKIDLTSGFKMCIRREAGSDL
jgi:hypothetical protein